MTSRVTVWKRRSTIETLDRKILAFKIIVYEDRTRVTLILSGKEIDYDLQMLGSEEIDYDLEEDDEMNVSIDTSGLYWDLDRRDPPWPDRN